MEALIPLLQKLGCDEREAHVFATLVSEPEGLSVVQLSRKLNLPRPSIYGYIETLTAMGLVKRGRVGESARFYAESAEYVSDLFVEKASELDIARVQIETALTKAKYAGGYEPKFFFFNRPNATDLIFRDVLRSREKLIRWFVPIRDTLQVTAPRVLEHFHTERVKRGIKLRVLWPQKQKVNPDKYSQLLPADPVKSLREIRILPANIEMWLGYGIYGTRIAFSSSKRDNYGFIVDSVDLSNTLKSQFDFFWSISKKIDNY